ncbi:MAG TPA: hypothetical protein VGA21_10905 [Cyclobacteriaceae bacterium]|jgi:WD40 repeat protein/energy-coupling factor transporter ATP-binding protein EcfA2
MLNYEIHMEPREAEVLEAEIREDLKLSNPFPGLRPFSIDECHLFFGRESQVDEILQKLAENKFAAILGYSGSGKSSLLNCGLVPVLFGGFVTEKSPNWNVIISRPGIAPIDNLAEALLSKDPEYQSASEEEKIINKTIVSSVLRGSNTGLIDIARRHNLATGENLLIMIDQFEELFRYREEERIAESEDESTEFVNLLLKAVEQDEVPIYLTISMRSDYMGACSKYPRLTDKINQSNYLVPQMTREKRRIAIEGPIAVGGGRISERLVSRLMQDMGDNQDQLPILQHALMRTWEYWVEHKEPGEPMDIRHYNAVGRMSEALSQHANEAYDELSTRHKEIAEILFKTITEKGVDNFGIRKPTKVGVIAEIAGVDAFDVIEVIEHFRKPGRSLLMPAAPFKLTPDSVIEVSHESLMRIWTRLKNWVEEESESAQMYLRLSDAAAMYQVGRTGLWRPPDLQLALNWQKKQKPTRIWARRYDEAFERAIVFLDTSRITYEAEQRNQELQQKRLLRRTRAVAVILAIAAIVAIFFFIFGITQRIEADTQRVLAEQRAEEAETSKIAAEQSADEAIKERENALEQTRLAESNAQIADFAKRDALANLEFAEQQAEIARKQTAIAQAQTKLADSARLVAEEKTAEALRANEEASRLLLLSIAQSMSVKALNVKDPDLKGLLAQQAFFFNNDNGGKEYDNYIYEGLNNAMSAYYGVTYNKFSGHQNAVRTVAFSQDGKNIFTAGSDGQILKWAFDSRDSIPMLLGQKAYPRKMIKVSPDNKWLAVASDSSSIELYDLVMGGRPIEVTGHKGLVYDIEFTPDSKGLYSSGYDQTLRYFDFAKSRLIKNLPGKMLSITVSPDGSRIVTGGLDGNVYIYDTQAFNEKLLLELPGNIIQSVKFSKKGDLIGVGDQFAIVRLLDSQSGEVLNELIGATAQISDVEFSKDDKLVAAGSRDGTVHIWIMSNLDDLPLNLTGPEMSHIWDVDFSPDGEYIVASSSNGVIRYWPTHAETLSQEMCDLIIRNFTQREWERYVGNKVEYQITCNKSLSLRK